VSVTVTTVQVTGSPTPEELAAVLAVVASSGGATEEPTEQTGSRWSDRASMLRRPLPHGPGAWRATR
jgi:hypothetical protein